MDVTQVLVATEERQLLALKAIAEAPINEDTNFRELVFLFQIVAEIALNGGKIKQ